MKHTPGPWEVSNSKRQVGKRASNGSLNLLADTTNSCFYEEDKANARLIASCPELLEACRALISNAVWDGKTREHGSANEYTVHKAVIEAAQRAVNRAEGRKS